MEMNTGLSPVEEYLHDLPVVEASQATMASAIPSIKVEDHIGHSTITPDLLSLATPPPESSPSASSKGVKKRKSWGQVLPEPKTSLPPRKRAKTADEKEQRRIERVKRNRLAAHNSRERKREEMDRLQVKNDALKDRMHQMQKQMEAMTQELKAFRNGSTPAAQAFDFTTEAAPASIVSPAMTATASSTLQTPELGNLDSPRSEFNDDFSAPATPIDTTFAAEEEISLEQTQQSAALLCDLQCRSPETYPSCPRSSSPRHFPNPPNPSRQTLALTAILTASLNIQLFLSITSSLSSTLTSSSSSLRRLLMTTASSPPNNNNTNTSTSSTTARQFLLSAIYWTMALAHQATSSTSSQPTKAHLQKVATGLAAQLRRELMPSSSPTRSSCEETTGAAAGGDVTEIRRQRRRQQRQQRRRTAGLSRHGRRIVVSWNVKQACSALGSADRRRASSSASLPGLGAVLQKLRERGVGRC